MKQILVIAKDMRAARHEARYQAYRLERPDRLRETYGEIRSLDGALAVFYACPKLATQQMVGLRLDEIVIVGDWPRWDFGPPGAFSNFAGMMAIQMAHGATRRWER